MLETLGYIALIFVVLPVLTYLVIKFGAAAYFREKNKNNKDK